eukprot:1150305-Pelagomonas_calceolata.AAC.3
MPQLCLHLPLRTRRALVKVPFNSHHQDQALGAFPLPTYFFFSFHGGQQNRIFDACGKSDHQTQETNQDFKCEQGAIRFLDARDM